MGKELIVGDGSVLDLSGVQQFISAEDETSGLSTERKVDLARKVTGSLDYSSQEAYDARRSWRETDGGHQVVMVVGSGKTSEEACKALIANNVHPLVLTAEPVHGGMAVAAINTMLHPSAKLNALKSGAATFSRPELDILFRAPVNKSEIGYLARMLKVSGVVWAAGAETKRIDGLDYGLPGVHDVLDFLVPFNQAFDNQDGDVAALAGRLGYTRDVNGVPLPTVAQVGGKSGEDIAVGDVGIRIVDALHRHGFSRENISRFDLKAFFALSREVGLDSALQTIGLSKDYIGRTVFLYHGECEQMNLFPPSSVAIDNAYRRKGAGAESRAEVEKELKHGSFAKVPEQLTIWAKTYGVEFVSNRRVAGVQNTGDGLNLEVVQLADKTTEVGRDTVQAGLVVTSVGFTKVNQDHILCDRIPVVLAGMAANGTGALAESVYSAPRAVDTLLAQMGESGVRHDYQTVLRNVAVFRSGFEGAYDGQGYERDVVTRMVEFGPSRLMAPWFKG